MKILVVDLAQYGNEQTVLTTYVQTDDEWRSIRLRHGADLATVVERVKETVAEYTIDAVCVDESGYGVALADALKRFEICVCTARSFSRKP